MAAPSVTTVRAPAPQVTSRPQMPGAVATYGPSVLNFGMPTATYGPPLTGMPPQPSNARATAPAALRATTLPASIMGGVPGSALAGPGAPQVRTITGWPAAAGAPPGWGGAPPMTVVRQVPAQARPVGVAAVSPQQAFVR